MWTRRRLLLSSGAIAACLPPLAAALPSFAAPRGPLRVGLLQSAPPFIDARDRVGSSQRALAAFIVLIERSIAADPAIDWLAGGPAALEGALGRRDRKLASLHEIAHSHQIRISLGSRWRERDGSASKKLLVFEPDGSLSTARLNHSDAWIDAAIFAAACARVGLPGAYIEPACDPATAPDVYAPIGGGTALYGADGAALARATTQAETCVVGCVS